MASQETFLTVVAADALHATGCGIKATYNRRLLRVFVVRICFCAIRDCSKRLYKCYLHRGIDGNGGNLGENRHFVQQSLACREPFPSKCSATALQASALTLTQGQTTNVSTIPRLRTTTPPLKRCLVLENAPFRSPLASRPMPGLRSFAKKSQGSLLTARDLRLIGISGFAWWPSEGRESQSPRHQCDSQFF